MKYKLAFIFCIAVIVSVLMASTFRVKGAGCFRFTIPLHVGLYSEANLASNIIATVEPNDVFYICGDS